MGVFMSEWVGVRMKEEKESFRLIYHVCVCVCVSILSSVWSCGGGAFEGEHRLPLCVCVCVCVCVCMYLTLLVPKVEVCRRTISSQWLSSLCSYTYT